MSQLKLSGDASGTGIVTVAAPNTNSTYTVTLPAAAGTIVTGAAGSNTQVQYNNAGAFGGITNATTDGTTLSMTSPKVITGINDTNGNELLKVTATASAVNELTLANAATGGNPVLSATGGDTNIGITLTPKGTGGVVFPAGAVGTPAITTTGDTNTGVYFPGADSVAITTGGTAAVTVDSGQRTKFPTTIGIGNATPSTSGSGITFPATQSASTDANTLDDYEEGTWTPSLTVNGFNNSATLSSASGVYTKIGRLVTVQCTLNMSTSCRPTSYCDVSGLPFSSASLSVGAFAGVSPGLGIQGGSVEIYANSVIQWYPTNGTTNSTQWICTVTYNV